MKIDDLNLEEPALSAAIELQESIPDVVFTDGKRSRAVQAERMARNVLDDQWIANTYAHSAPALACQAAASKYLWGKHGELREVLFAALNKFTDEELAHLSAHLGGEAFDVEPWDGARGVVLEAALQKIAEKYGGKFIKNEGGKRIFHAQFRRQ